MKKVMFTTAIALAAISAVGAANAQSNIVTLASEQPLRSEGDDAQAVLTAAGAGPSAVPSTHSMDYREATSAGAKLLGPTAPPLPKTSFTLYGSMYGGLGYNFGKAPRAVVGTANDRNYAAMGASGYFGFSIKEDLGGGTAVFSLLQSGFAPKTGALTGTVQYGRQTFFNDYSWLGIQNLQSWGSIWGGRIATRMASTVAKVADASQGYSMAALTNVMDSGGGTVSNGIAYSTAAYDPQTITRYPGFAFSAQYYFGENSNGYRMGAGKGFNVSWMSPDTRSRTEFAIAKMNTYCGPGETYQSGTGAACNGAVNDVDNTGWVLATYYDFNALRLNAAYGQAHKTNRITGTRNTDTSDFLIGFSGLQIGQGKLLVTLVRHTDKGTNTAAYWKNNARRSMATWMLGANYDYYLSKRTKIQMGLMLMRSNSDYALMPLSATYQGGQAGNFRSNGITIGVSHRF